MINKKFLKTGAVVATMVLASMFGFSTAWGYGGGGGGGGLAIIANNPTYCSAVVYSEWGACVNGMQYRNVVSQAPNGCVMSSAQQLDRSKVCSTNEPVVTNNQPVVRKPFFTRTNTGTNSGTNTANNNGNTGNNRGTVLGERVFAEGTLIRIVGNPRTYVIINGKQVHIKTLAELAKYRGQKINFYYEDGRAVDQVLGVKTLPDGSLVRLVGSNKIYVMVNGQRVHLKTQADLDKHKGKKINLLND